MYEIAIKGSSRAIEINSTEKMQVVAFMGDPKIPFDAIIEIGGAMVKKGEIKGVFQTDAADNAVRENTDKIKAIRNDLNQISEVIALKKIQPAERTNLGYLNLAVFAATGRGVTEEERTQVRKLETEYFINNPTHAIYFDSAKLKELFGEKIFNTSAVNGSFRKLAIDLVPGYIKEIREWQQYSGNELVSMWKDYFIRFKNTGGDPNQRDVVTKKLLLVKLH